MANEVCQAIKTDNSGAAPVHKQCGKPATHAGDDGRARILVCDDCIPLIQKLVPNATFRQL